MPHHCGDEKQLAGSSPQTQMAAEPGGQVSCCTALLSDASVTSQQQGVPHHLGGE